MHTANSRRHFPSTLLAALSSLLLFSHLPAHAATQTWNPNGNNTGGNGIWDSGITPDWDTGVVWTNGNDALFSGTGGTVTTVDPTANSLTFSATGLYLLQGETFTLSGSNVTVNSDTTIASGIVAESGINLSGTATLSLTGNSTLFAGLFINSPTLDITSGGTVNSEGPDYIGFNPGSGGTLSVSGTGSTFTDDNLFIGNSGSGTLNISNDGSVSSEFATIGAKSGSAGVVTVSGSGSQWNISQGLDIGPVGAATLDITAGGAVSDTFANVINKSTILISGSGSTWTSGVGPVNTAGGGNTLAITNGGSIVAPAGISISAGDTLALGENPIVSGSLNVSGGLTLVDGQLQTVTLTKNLTLTPTAVLSFEVGNGSDELAFAPGAVFNPLAVSAGHGPVPLGPSETNHFTVNLYGLSGQVTSGTDVIIGYDPASAPVPTLGDVYNSGNFTYSLVDSGNSIEVVVTPATPLTTAYWKGGQGNVWSVLVGGTASNWTTDSAGTIDPGLTPSATTDVIFSATGDANEGNTLLGTDMTIKSLTINDPNAVVISGSDSDPLLPSNDTLTISATSAITVNPGAGPVTIGANLTLTSASGNITVNNAAGLLISGTFGGDLDLVKSGTGTLTVSGPANFGPGYDYVAAEFGTLAIKNTFFDSYAYIAQGPSSDGLVTVSGTAAAWNTATTLYVGFQNIGALSITGGGAVSADTTYLGFFQSSSGTVTVSGSGSTLSNSSYLVVGAYGNGSLVVSGGALVSDSNGYVGPFGTDGTVTVSGSGSMWTNSYSLDVSGSGSMSISSGGAVSDQIGSIGLYASSSVTVDGTGSSWTNSKGLTIGEAYNGTLTITNGGAVSSGSDSTLGAMPGTTGNASLTGSNSTWTTNGTLYVGGTGVGLLSIFAGASVSDSNAYLANAQGSQVAATVATGSKWTNSGALSVGEAGNAVLDLLDSGTVSAEVGYIGDLQHSTGTVGVTSAGSVWTDSTALYVGQSGNGTFDISDGGIASAEESILGNAPSGNGTAAVSGAGSTWTTSTSLYIGGSGSGIFSVSAGGSVSDSEAYVGTYAGSLGAATVSGSGSKWTNLDSLSIGQSGSGALTITTRGVVSDEIGYVGNLARSIGTAIVSGSGSLWSNSEDLFIGQSGTGSLLINAGGAVSAGTTYIGANLGSNGAVVVSGSGSTLTSTGDLYIDGLFPINNDGAGILAILNGGLVSTANATFLGAYGTLEINGASPQLDTGSLTITGGTIRTLGASIFSNSATIESAGLVINSGGFNSTFSGDLNGPGGIFKTGAGTITLTGTSTLSEDLVVAGAGGLDIASRGVVSDAIGSIGYGSTTATVSGAGSQWTSTSTLAVGYSGTGSLLVSSGGAVVADKDTFIGFGAGSHGALTITGAGSQLTTTGNLSDGYSATGVLTIAGGGLAHSGSNSYIGLQAHSTGIASVSGAGSKFTSTGNLAVGYSGTGTLLVTTGGAVSDASAYIGLNAGAIGTASISGTGSTWTSSKNLLIGTNGKGSLILAGGGEVTVTGATILGGQGSIALSGKSPFDTGSLAIEGADPQLTFTLGNTLSAVDTLGVNQIATLLSTGAKISIAPLAGDTSLTAGSYNLITASGGFSGKNGNGFTLTDPTIPLDGSTYHLTLADSTKTTEILTITVGTTEMPSLDTTSDPESASIDTFPAPSFTPDPASLPTPSAVSTPTVTFAAVPEPNFTPLLLALAAFPFLRRK